LLKDEEEGFRRKKSRLSLLPGLIPYPYSLSLCK